MIWDARNQFEILFAWDERIEVEWGEKMKYLVQIQVKILLKVQKTIEMEMTWNENINQYKSHEDILDMRMHCWAWEKTYL